MKRGEPFAAVMLAKVALVELTFGDARTVWLKAFRNSARNCNLRLSPSEKFLTPDYFHTSIDGALTPEKRAECVSKFQAS
jgi:hypothetical protein